MITATEFNSLYQQLYSLSLLVFAGALTVALPLQFAPSRFKGWVASLPIWVAPVAFGLGLRLMKINQPLWYDEFFTLTIARLFPSPQFWAVVLGDVHPPTWYLISALFDTGAVWLIRLPSLLASVGVIIVAGQIAGRLYDRPAANAAMWLMATMSGQIVYAGEARVYALMTLIALIAFWAILAEKPLAYFLSAGALGWLHGLGFAHLGILSCVALWYWRGRHWPAVLSAIAVSGLWLPFMLSQAGDVMDGFWLPAFRFGALTLTVVELTAGLGVPQEFAWIAFALSLGLIVFGLSRLRFTRARVAALLYAVLPPIGVGILSTQVNTYLPRAFLPSVTLLAIVLIAGSLYQHRAWLIVACTAFAMLNIAMPARPDFGPVLADCDAVYYGSNAAAMMGMALRPDLTPHIRNNPDDLNQQFPESTKQALGFEYTLPRGEFCAFRFITAYTTPEENAAFGALSPFVKHTTTIVLSPLWHIQRLDMVNNP